MMSPFVPPQLGKATVKESILDPLLSSILDTQALFLRSHGAAARIWDFLGHLARPITPKSGAKSLSCFLGRDNGLPWNAGAGCPRWVQKRRFGSCANHFRVFPRFSEFRPACLKGAKQGDIARCTPLANFLSEDLAFTRKGQSEHNFSC